MDPFWGGMDLRCGPFLMKMYAKMKELGPVEGLAPEDFVCRSTNVNLILTLFSSGGHFKHTLWPNLTKIITLNANARSCQVKVPAWMVEI